MEYYHPDVSLLISALFGKGKFDRASFMAHLNADIPTMLGDSKCRGEIAAGMAQETGRAPPQ
uniref:Uncharacterized protein n=1 Tax=viral metagenome TaxID=1070528 RepID=A0A6M3KXB6_9ZZZZ